MTYNRYDCPECDALGSVVQGRQGGNDPDIHRQTCPLCEGSGSVDAETLLNYAMTEIRVARKCMRSFDKKHYRKQAKFWIGKAKEARADVLAEQHAGANHLG